MFKTKKGDIELEEMGKWIIALVILVVMVVGYFVLSSKGKGAVEFISNLFKFGS